MVAVLTAYRWEVRKLLAQRRSWLGIAAAAAGPIIFLISIQISKITPGRGPYDTPLGTNLRDTGLTLDLVVTKLVAIVGPTLVAALVAGDIVAAEEAGGTLKTILVRSLRRWHVLAGKALAVFSYLLAALATFAVVGIGVAVIAWGFHPVVDLSGHTVSAGSALGLTLLSLVFYGLPTLAIAAFALFLSVATRNSVAAVAGTLLYALVWQGLDALSAIAGAHPFLLYAQFRAWHGLYQTPHDLHLLVRDVWVSALFTIIPLVAATVIFNRRDVDT
jgi:ABC-2 type transport system permease protein